jgi:hypothetical protein
MLPRERLLPSFDYLGNPAFSVDTRRALQRDFISTSPGWLSRVISTDSYSKAFHASVIKAIIRCRLVRSFTLVTVSSWCVLLVGGAPPKKFRWQPLPCKSRAVRKKQCEIAYGTGCRKSLFFQELRFFLFFFWGWHGWQPGRKIQGFFDEMVESI